METLANIETIILNLKSQETKLIITIRENEQTQNKLRNDLRAVQQDLASYYIEIENILNFIEDKKLNKEQINSNGRLTRKQRNKYIKLGIQAYKNYPTVDKFKAYVFDIVKGEPLGINIQICMINGWKSAKDQFENSIKRIDDLLRIK